MYNGYDFYFKDGKNVLTLPITPSELTIKVGSNNKTVNLINGGDINVLKSPSLIEVQFEARFPMRQYPYAREFRPFEEYWEKFKELKEKKKPFRFIVSRKISSSSNFLLSSYSTSWDTNLLVALEDIELTEQASNGDDVLVNFKLKQYKEYGIKTLPNTATNTNKSTTSTAKEKRPTDKKTDEPTVHTVKSGDCLWNISKKYYGKGSKWKTIYEANKKVIEDTAKKRRGGKGSSNGHWIYPGTKLTIPKL